MNIKPVPQSNSYREPQQKRQEKKGNKGNTNKNVSAFSSEDVQKNDSSRDANVDHLSNQQIVDSSKWIELVSHSIAGKPRVTYPTQAPKKRS